MIVDNMLGVYFQCQSIQDAEEALDFLECNGILWASGREPRSGAAECVYLQNEADRENYVFCIDKTINKGYRLYYDRLDVYIEDYDSEPITWTDYKAAYINDNLVTVSLSEYMI